MRAIRIFDPTDEIEEDTLFSSAVAAATFIQGRLDSALELDEPFNKIEVSIIDIRDEEYGRLVGLQPYDFPEE